MEITARRTPLEARISTQTKREIGKLGLEISGEKMHKLYEGIQRRLGIGLERREEPVMTAGGLANDGGLACFKTGVSPEISNQIPDNTEAYIASIGGTNFKFSKATKNGDQIEIVVFNETAYTEELEKKFTFDQFVEKMVKPIFDDYIEQTQPGVDSNREILIGISLGFPHKNTVTEEGVDAELRPQNPDDGELPKRWKITDWTPDLEKKFIDSIKAYAEGRGITPKSFDIAILNDGPATRLDGTAIKITEQLGLEVLDVSGIQGTGINISTEKDGLVNIEMGRFPLGDLVDPVTERMLENLAAQSGQTEEILPELEHITGGKYMPERLRAALQLLTEEQQLPEQEREHMKQIADWISFAQHSMPGLMSQLAGGKVLVSDTIQYLAQLILKQAGQAFGTALAAVLQEKYGDRSSQAGLLLEGSVANHAYGVKDEIEKAAAGLGQPITIVEADSKKGIAALVMSLSTQRKEAKTDSAALIPLTGTS